MLTHARLLELLHYAPETGVWTWRVMRANGKMKPGMKAGSIRNCRSGQRAIICVDNIRYFAARLAWFYMTGKWPKHQVDHADKNCLNNKWKNLRDATPSENSYNRNGWTKSGHKGVHLRENGKWTVYIHVRKKQMCFGTYEDFELACLVADDARDKYHGAFARKE